MYLMLGTKFGVIVKGTSPQSMEAKSVYNKDFIPLHSCIDITWKSYKKCVLLH